MLEEQYLERGKHNIFLVYRLSAVLRDVLRFLYRIKALLIIVKTLVNVLIHNVTTTIPPLP